MKTMAVAAGARKSNGANGANNLIHLKLEINQSCITMYLSRKYTTLKYDELGFELMSQKTQLKLFRSENGEIVYTETEHYNTLSHDEKIVLLGTLGALWFFKYVKLHKSSEIINYCRFNSEYINDVLAFAFEQFANADLDNEEQARAIVKRCYNRARVFVYHSFEKQAKLRSELELIIETSCINEQNELNAAWELIHSKVAVFYNHNEVRIARAMKILELRSKGYVDKHIYTSCNISRPHFYRIIFDLKNILL